jgi:hypothetical protein
LPGFCAIQELINRSGGEERSVGFPLFGSDLVSLLMGGKPG